MMDMMKEILLKLKFKQFLHFLGLNLKCLTTLFMRALSRAFG